jgi:hypothetical protein
MHRRKLLIAVALIAWSGFVVTAYFVVQKPFALQVADSLLKLAWTLIVTSMLLWNGLVLGLFTIGRLIPNVTRDAPLLALACGIGLGELGLLGFVFAAAGVSNFYLLLMAQLLLLGWSVWQGLLSNAVNLIKSSMIQIRASLSRLPLWMQAAVILAASLTFLRTLLPPADAFDALLYHLTVPALWLQDGGLRAYNIPHYWFPGLVEGIYFWGLGLASEVVTQQIHFVFALCTMILVWDWSRRLWDDLTAGWGLMLLVSMPSLLLLSSWAYTDLALIFFGLAMLYTLAFGRELNDSRWWMLSAIAAGMAMGVKYTSFVMPVTAVLLLVSWNFQRKRELVIELLRFGLISSATALIWYVRNWIWMWNPVYPFVLGGRYWDEFRSLWYANPGTGSGWDIGALVLLPLTVTLGYEDVNGIDADIGPLLLLALPLALWAMTGKKSGERFQKISMLTIGLFTLFGVAFWVYGYITTKNLWQARLMLPAIVPFLIPASAGVASIRGLATKRLRLSFIVSSIAALAIYVNLFDIGLSVISRNPLAIATGIVTRTSYFEKYQSGYADALQMVSQTTPDSRVYFLFEPRSYGMVRKLQPDPILDNFSHDILLYGTPGNIIRAWKSEGYTHVLLNRRNALPILESTGQMALLDETIDLLKSLANSRDQNYELLEIPAASSE